MQFVGVAQKGGGVSSTLMLHRQEVEGVPSKRWLTPLNVEAIQERSSKADRTQLHWVQSSRVLTVLYCRSKKLARTLPAHPKAPYLLSRHATGILHCRNERRPDTLMIALGPLRHSPKFSSHVQHIQRQDG